ncbi:MAG: alpha-amylase family glycosyl hydrolase, partial [Candidatus Krumholzibacteria bacterium]|nr:alpha-amylase family glycosyl hydrolase [Candidatus Krumholzibacteria bacterium]
GRNDPYGAAPHPSRYIDVAARAGHLAELGVNAVMINPVTEFPGDLSGGYNPITAWAPEWAYGSPDDLKSMVDALHLHGIAVLLDIVWNHFSFSDNYLWYYDGTQIYFDDPAVETRGVRRQTSTAAPCASTSSARPCTGSRSTGSTGSAWTRPHT